MIKTDLNLNQEKLKIMTQPKSLDFDEIEDKSMSILWIYLWVAFTVVSVALVLLGIVPNSLMYFIFVLLTFVLGFPLLYKSMARDAQYKAQIFALAREGRHREAGLKCIEWLEKKPKEYAALNNLACAYENLGDLENLKKLCEKAMKDHPNKVVHLYSLMEAHVNVKQFEEALDVYHQIKSIDPNDLYSDLCRASIHAMEGDNESALMLLERIFFATYGRKRVIKYQIGPKYYAKACYDLARAYLRVGRIEDAMQICKLHPHVSSYNKEYGRKLKRLGENY